MERDDPADTSDHTSDPPRRQHPTLNKYRTSRTLHHQNTIAGRRKSRILPTDAAVVFGSPTDWVVQGTGQRVHRCIYKATRTPAGQQASQNSQQPTLTDNARSACPPC
ncbi:hypothetical protein D9611_009981 [Ephemerocybe angulata]|uniref:Uncharacterized protein n=1 Tax=Ephemerocybe angulata TaxID=980116 RepID=A0A8H5C458_9AGAR|nr:hypothetical protein D9611_009981 [Tulosesus angulatus]